MVPTQLDELRMVSDPALEVTPTQLEEPCIAPILIEETSFDLAQGGELPPGSRDELDFAQGIEGMEL